MSSVGPSIAIVTDRSREAVAKLIEPLGLEIAIETKVDNEGLKVHMAAAARAGASEDDGPGCGVHRCHHRPEEGAGLRAAHVPGV